MSVFPNAQNLNLSGGYFINHTEQWNGPSGIDVLRKVSYPEAAHDASSREYSPRCFPGTRNQYIEDIVHWVAPTFGGTPTPLYWMKGPAGVGKSAIAQTCAEALEKLGKLGASFFFSISDRDRPDRFFPSIAYQLSNVYPSYRDLVDTKIRQNESLVQKTMRLQFRYLIEEPLRELQSQGKGIGNRIFVIVDGLDECEGSAAQLEIIDTVAGAALEGTLPLCWIFFSRPESHIEAAFAKPSIAPHCHKVILPISRDVDGEIELYFQYHFENILQRRNSSMKSPWPSTQDMKTLVGAASGFFLFATTVIRFIDHRGLGAPEKRLRAVIDVILNPRTGTSPGTDAPFAELDAFYGLTLQRVPTEIFPSVHQLLALMCQHGPLSAIVGANALGMSKDELEVVCNCFTAVARLIEPAKDLELDPTIDTSRTYTQIGRDVLGKLYPRVRFELGGELSFYHKSFVDFLVDPKRSGSYCVTGSEALARFNPKIHLDYDRSYCWQGSELILAPGVTDSASSLSYPWTNELVNSLVKASAYTISCYEDPYGFSVLCTGSGTLETTGDFRKRLHVDTSLSSCARPFPDSGLLWGCDSRAIQYPGTSICWISLADFNVTEFKSMVKQRQKANVIRQYRPRQVPRIKFRFGKKTEERFESAVYQIGHDEKSIFWYWEINYELGHYREFRTINLAEGEKRFREEDFASWPSLGWYDSESKQE